MTAHTNHAMHQHSLTSYRDAIDALGRRASTVLAWINCNEPATDRQVMAGMGFTDPNKVRPRITELIQLGLLKEAGTRRENGRTVRVVECAPINASRQQESLFHAH